MLDIGKVIHEFKILDGGENNTGWVTDDGDIWLTMTIGKDGDPYPYVATHLEIRDHIDAHHDALHGLNEAMRIAKERRAQIRD